MSDFDDLLKIQRMMQERAQQEVEQDRTVELMALVGSLVPEKKKVQLEKIYYIASLKGFSESQVNEVLKKNIHDGIMFQPEVGYIQRENN